MNKHDSHIVCNRCKKGLMTPTAEIEKNKYVHKCSKCKNKACFLAPF